MHNWGDPGVDWEGISDAAEYIASRLKRWRVPVRDWKEKYGTVRIYTDFGWNSIHDLTHPGHVWTRYKRDGLLWKLNYSTGFNKIFRLLNFVVVPFHQFLYTYYYGKAIKKWPHLRSEILHGADFNELLTKFGVHQVRTSENGYSIYYDWHPDNFVYPKGTEETELEDKESGS